MANSLLASEKNCWNGRGITMVITKIHPIKSTLHCAINYIVNDEKTDEQLLVSTHKCHESSAHTRVLNPLSTLMSTSKKQPMKGKIYRIKSKLLIRKYLQSYPLLFCNPCFYISFFQTKKAVRFYSNHLRYIPNIITLFQFFNRFTFR